MSWDLNKCRQSVSELLEADAIFDNVGPVVYRDFLILDSIPEDYNEELYRIEVATRYCLLYDSLPVHILGNTTFYKLCNMPYNMPKYYEDNHVVLGIECDDKGVPKIIKWEKQANMNKICKTLIFSGSGIISAMATHAKHNGTTFVEQLRRLQNHLKSSETGKLLTTTSRLFLLDKKEPLLQPKDFQVPDDEQPKNEHVKASDEVRYTFTSSETLELLIKNSTKSELMHKMESYRS